MKNSAAYSLAFLQLALATINNAISGAPQKHPYSTYSIDLKRYPSIGSSWHHGGAQASSVTILDNQRMKYLVPITFGDQTLEAELDAGSSDTWLVQTGFQCYYTFDNASKTFEQPQTQSFCNYGPSYSVDLDFRPVPDFYQLTCYGSGKPTYRCLYGPFGYTDVTLAGLVVKSQIVAAPNKVGTNRSTV